MYRKKDILIDRTIDRSRKMDEYNGEYSQFTNGLKFQLFIKEKILISFKKFQRCDVQQYSSKIRSPGTINL